MKLKTRVKIGKYDIELSIKMPNSTVWKNEPLPGDLPKIDLDPRAGPAMTSSPPPGRPGRAELPADAVEGDLENEEAIEAEKAKKRQLSDNSDSDSDEPVKKSKGDVQDSDAGDWSKIMDNVAVVLDMEDAANSNNTGDLVEQRNRGSPSPLSRDPGRFINQESYCPSSPARSKTIPDLSIIVNSPVYHSKAAKNMK